MGLLYGRAGRLTAENGGFRPGQQGAEAGSARAASAPPGAEAGSKRPAPLPSGRAALAPGAGRAAAPGRCPRCQAQADGRAYPGPHTRAQGCGLDAGGGAGETRGASASPAARGGPAPPPSATVRAALGRLSALSVFLCKSVFYGTFVWARRAINSQKRRFPARAVSPPALAGDSLRLLGRGQPWAVGSFRRALFYFITDYPYKI
jgi:hypothetical protein